MCENEFAESSDCLMAYNKIYEVRVRMGKRLGTERKTRISWILLMASNQRYSISV